MEPIHVEREPAVLTLDGVRCQLARVLAGTPVERAIVFGSYARGEADGSSDLDLVLIEATDLPFVERGLRYIGRLGFAPGVDLLVYTPEEFERMRARGSGFIETIEREGVTVYER